MTTEYDKLQVDDGELMLIARVWDGVRHLSTNAPGWQWRVTSNATGSEYLEDLYWSAVAQRELKLSDEDLIRFGLAAETKGDADILADVWREIISALRNPEANDWRLT